MSMMLTFRALIWNFSFMNSAIKLGISDSSQLLFSSILHWLKLFSKAILTFSMKSPGLQMVTMGKGISETGLPTLFKVVSTGSFCHIVYDSLTRKTAKLEQPMQMNNQRRLVRGESLELAT